MDGARRTGPSSGPLEPGRGRDWRPAALVALLVAAIAVAVVVIAVDGGDQALDNPTPADIAENPTLYASEPRVSITGEVASVYELPPADPGDDARRVFALVPDVEGGLLVVPVGDAGAPRVTEGDSIEVQGNVQGFFAGGFRGAFGRIPAGFNFGRGERTVVLATEVSRAGGADSG